LTTDWGELHQRLAVIVAWLGNNAHLLVTSSAIVLSSTFAGLSRFLGVLSRLLKVIVVDVLSSSIDARPSNEVRVPLLMWPLRTKWITTLNRTLVARVFDVSAHVTPIFAIFKAAGSLVYFVALG